MCERIGCVIVPHRPCGWRSRSEVACFGAPNATGVLWQRVVCARQKSTRMTARRALGLLTSPNPAAMNVLQVPTWSSSSMTFVVVIG